MVVEERFLKKSGYAPLNVVGMEGLWGVILMVVIIMPVLYFIPGDDNGSYENALDALVQIRNSPSLLIFNIGYLLSIAFYNFFGLSVAKKLTSVHRTLIDGTCYIRKKSTVRSRSKNLEFWHKLIFDII